MDTSHEENLNTQSSFSDLYTKSLKDGFEIISKQTAENWYKGLGNFEQY